MEITEIDPFAEPDAWECSVRELEKLINLVAMRAMDCGRAGARWRWREEKLVKRMKHLLNILNTRSGDPFQIN